MTPEEKRRLGVAAGKDRRSSSEWVRLLVEEALDQGRSPAPEPEIPVQVIEFGEWLRDLPVDVRVKVGEIGEALKLLKKKYGSGATPLPLGTVENSWLPASKEGKGRKAAKRQARKAPRSGS